MSFFSLLVISNQQINSREINKTYQKIRFFFTTRISYTINLVNSARELNLSGAHRLDNRPSLLDVQTAFKRATNMAYSCSITTSLVLVVIWPACMVAVGVMDLSAFVGWVSMLSTLRETWVAGGARGAPASSGSSVGRVPYSRSRNPGIETCARHLVMGSDST